MKTVRGTAYARFKNHSLVMTGPPRAPKITILSQNEALIEIYRSSWVSASNYSSKMIVYNEVMVQHQKSVTFFP